MDWLVGGVEVDWMVGGDVVDWSFWWWCRRHGSW